MKNEFTPDNILRYVSKFWENPRGGAPLDFDAREDLDKAADQSLTALLALVSTLPDRESVTEAALALQGASIQSGYERGMIAGANLMLQLLGYQKERRQS